MIRGMLQHHLRLITVLTVAVATAASANAQLKIYGNTTTIELAPVLLAAQDLYGDTTAVVHGGIPDLFDAEQADVATNAETQALRQSVDHPDLRTILTVSEGFYRLVARRSAGIATVADLRGKRITTAPNTSSHYYLYKLLGTAGLTTRDVTVVPITPLSGMTPALVDREVDAVTIWEPEIERALQAIGADAIELQLRPLYREIFGLHTTAAKLADPAKRREIVAFVRAVVRASERIRARPQEVWPLVAERTGYELALIEKVWRHEGYPGALVPDLLDVIVDEDVFLAPERNRAPRPRAELAVLIDASVLREALAD
jgi:NitT/TauT family transport system substrate-binding protein